MIKYHHLNWKYTLGLMLEIQIFSQKETRDQQGFTHLAEHLLFYGNKDKDYNKLSEDIYNLFGKLEAVTDPNSVRIYAQFDIKDIELVKVFLSNMIYNSDLKEKDFFFVSREIYEEIQEYTESSSFYHKKRIQKYIPKLHSLVGNWEEGELTYKICKEAQEYWNASVQKSSIENYFIGNWQDDWIKDFQNIFKQKNNIEVIKKSEMKIMKTSSKELIYEYLINYTIKQDIFLSWLEEVVYKNNMESLIFNRGNKKYFSIISDIDINLNLFEYKSFKKAFDYIKKIYLSGLGMDIDGINYKSTLNRLQLYNKIADIQNNSLEDIYYKIKLLQAQDFQEYFTSVK